MICIARILPKLPSAFRRALWPSPFSLLGLHSAPCSVDKPVDVPRTAHAWGAAGLGLSQDRTRLIGLLLEAILHKRRTSRTQDPKGNQPWRSDTEAEGPLLRLLDVNSWLTGKHLDAGEDWGQEENGAQEDEILGWHHPLGGHEFEQTPRDIGGWGNLACCSPWGWGVGLNSWTELNWDPQ